MVSVQNLSNPIKALLLISINEPTTLSSAGREVWNDPTKYYKLSEDIKAAIKHGYLKREGKAKPAKYRADFSKILEVLLDEQKSNAYDGQKSWKQFFIDVGKPFDHLREFYSLQPVRESLFDKKLILSLLVHKRLDKRFMTNSFYYFMELPLVIMLHEHYNLRGPIKSNVLHHLFMVEEYVDRLHKVHAPLHFHFIAQQLHKISLDQLISLCERYYRKGKTLFDYAITPPSHGEHIDEGFELIEDYYNEDYYN